jgi:hypothetical protein
MDELFSKISAGLDIFKMKTGQKWTGWNKKRFPG